jgi:hypothetical protein
MMKKAMQNGEVIWCEKDGVPHAIDVLTYRDGAAVGKYSNKRLYELDLEYRRIYITSVEYFVERQEAALRTDPMRITEAEFDHALNIIPPMDYGKALGVTSFKMIESQSGRITRIYASLNDAFWTFLDRDDLSIEAIAHKILDVA